MLAAAAAKTSIGHQTRRGAGVTMIGGASSGYSFNSISRDFDIGSSATLR